MLIQLANLTHMQHGKQEPPEGGVCVCDIGSYKSSGALQSMVPTNFTSLKLGALILQRPLDFIMVLTRLRWQHKHLVGPATNHFKNQISGVFGIALSCEFGTNIAS